MTYLRYVRSILTGFLLSCIVFLLAVFYQTGAPTESSRWIYEIYKIKSGIATSITAPKLVVVAGSNAHFGISCQMIHAETGVPCVNGGTHAGLSIDYILNRAHSLVKPGDIVLLPIEYELYQNNGTPSNLLIDYVFSRDTNYLHSVDLITKIRFILGMPAERLRLGITAKINPPTPLTIGYQSKSLNRYGDETSNRKSSMTESEIKYIDSLKPIQVEGNKTSRYARKKISNFIHWCRQNQIKVVATWPNTIWFDVYRETSKLEFFQSLEDFYSKLGISTLGKPRDFMYDKSMFFDTIYHLNDKGVHYRTQQLIHLLRPYLEGINNVN